MVCTRHARDQPRMHALVSPAHEPGGAYQADNGPRALVDHGSYDTATECPRNSRGLQPRRESVW